MEGQRKLSGARVLVVGAGALGSVAATYLCAAGVGHLAIADFDTIDISNLQRQVMYATADAGLPKCTTLADKLHRLNPDVEVVAIKKLIRRADALELFGGYDFIVDGTDNPETKFTISQVCSQLGKPCTIGGVENMRGQLTTFVPGSTPFHELIGEAGSTGFTPCSVAGVLGPAAGVVASMLAAEAIKAITGAGTLLTDRILFFDLAQMNFNCVGL